MGSMTGGSTAPCVYDHFTLPRLVLRLAARTTCDPSGSINENSPAASVSAMIS